MVLSIHEFFFLIWSRTQCNRWSSSNRSWLHVVHLFAPQYFISCVTRALVASFLQAEKCTPIDTIHVYVHSHACLQLPHLCKLKKEILLQKKKLKTQGAAGCPPVNWSLHLKEAVAETRSTLTDISKVCIVLLLWHLERLISLTLCIISKVINHWSWIAEACYLPTALISWGARGNMSHP